MSVKTVAVARAPITATAAVEGSVFALREAIISTPLSGRLVDLEPMQSRAVRAGQVLAKVDAVEFVQAQKELRQARSTVLATEAMVTRRRALFEKGGIAKKDLEESELAWLTAKDELSAAERTVHTVGGGAALGNDGLAAVRAPFGGIIADQMQSDGEFVNEGTPLFKLVDVSGFIVKAEFPDTIASSLHEGSEAILQDNAIGNARVTGRLSMVGRTSDPVTRTVEVWVRVDDAAAPLRVGDAASVTVATQSAADAMVVPIDAVQLDVSTASEGVVMVVDATGVARETKVKLGIRAEGAVQILSGLRGSEQVVVEGNYGLPDGTRVTAESSQPGEGSAASSKPAPEKTP